MHRLIGRRIPDVELHGSSGQSIRLSQHQRRAIVVIYPYTGKPGVPNPPNWDLIPGAHGSTPQLLGYQALINQFNKHEVQLFGVSQLAHEWQAEFATRVGLGFLLLSDVNFQFSDSLELQKFTTGGADYLKRITLCVSDTSIVHVHDPVAEPENDAQLALEWARSP